MKIAIEGCCHGELDAIYSHIANLERQNQYKVDLLLICGDFQAVRNHRDLQCMAVPDKYRRLGGFYKYYTGEKRAPILTIVIGGNHEASNYFWELYHGGWLAPKIYFLGHAGCVQVNGVRIAGASGIFKSQDFRQGHWERLPYNHGSMRSIYHIREFNIMRLSLLTSPTIFLSHDWPQSIEHHGDLRGLLRRKPYFRTDIQKGELGSPPMMGILKTIKPEWWFSAHLHCRFEARVIHNEQRNNEKSSMIHEREQNQPPNPDEIHIDEEVSDDPDIPSRDLSFENSSKPSANVALDNPDEITLDEEVEEIASVPVHPHETNFLALDKCLPGRRFLEIIDVTDPVQDVGIGDAGNTPVLAYDPEWLAITRAFHPYMSLSRSPLPYPDELQAREAVRRELEWVKTHVYGSKGIHKVEDCQKFVMTAPGPGPEGSSTKEQPPFYPNPQTQDFCSILDIENKVDMDMTTTGSMRPASSLSAGLP